MCVCACVSLCFSLICIMERAGPCSGCVTAMTAGLVLITTNHRYKHTHKHTSVMHFRVLTPSGTYTSSSPAPAIFATTQSHL